MSAEHAEITTDQIQVDEGGDHRLPKRNRNATLGAWERATGKKFPDNHLATVTRLPLPDPHTAPVLEPSPDSSGPDDQPAPHVVAHREPRGDDSGYKAMSAKEVWETRRTGVHRRPSEMHPGEANGTMSATDVKQLRRNRDRAFFETNLTKHPGAMHQGEYQARHARGTDMDEPSVLSSHEAHAFRGDNRIYAQPENAPYNTHQVASQTNVTETGLPKRTPRAQRDQIPMSPFRAAPDREVSQSGALLGPATARPTLETNSYQTAETSRSRWTPRGIYERARNALSGKGRRAK